MNSRDYSKLLRVFCTLTMSCVCTTAFATVSHENIVTSKTSFHFSALYLQPNSNNLKYAVFVSGNQPYQQSWHNQTINPGFSPAFELGFNYAFLPSYDVSIDWMHASTSDSNSKQASQNTDIARVEFVAPPYDVGPGVFGIKKADSTVKSNFNSIGINMGKVFEYSSHVKGRLFGGLQILSISQNLTTTFSDYAGSPEIPGQAYPLPRDPRFYFTTKNSSNYTGIGPDVGLNVQYENSNGLGVIGQFAGSLTVGSMSAGDNFTSASTRLRLLGLDPSSQSITVPNSTQLVPGFDSKLGVLYTHAWRDLNMTIEGGYRFAYYINAISNVSPGTLVQAGEDETIPEFATGTMAINSTTTTNGPFSLSGPYLNLIIALA